VYSTSHLGLASCREDTRAMEFARSLQRLTSVISKECAGTNIAIPRACAFPRSIRAFFNTSYFTCLRRPPIVTLRILKQLGSVRRRRYNSSVGIATRLRAGQLRNRCSIPGTDKKLPSSTTSGSALELTKPPLQWLLVAVSSEVKRPGVELITHI
jgi:hypothetical protein